MYDSSSNVKSRIQDEKIEETKIRKLQGVLLKGKKGMIRNRQL